MKLLLARLRDGGAANVENRNDRVRRETVRRVAVRL
jgi:hypothetical protein